MSGLPFIMESYQIYFNVFIPVVTGTLTEVFTLDFQRIFRNDDPTLRLRFKF